MAKITFDTDKIKEGLEKVAKQAAEGVSKIDVKSLKDKAEDFADKMKEVASDPDVKEKLEELGEASVKALKKAAASASDLADGAKDAAVKAGKTVAAKTSAAIESSEDNIEKLKEGFEKQKKEIEEKGYSEAAYGSALQLVTRIATMPAIFVDREKFLRQAFGNSEHLEKIIKDGPQSVYTVESLKEKAEDIVQNCTRKTTVTSFLAGLPSNVALAIPAAGLDIAQFFAFALNMAQKISYLFGEEQLFTKPIALNGDVTDKMGVALPEAAQTKIIGYLGVMMGASGASSIVLKTSTVAGKNIGKKIATQALTKTTWYPVVKKVGSALGYKITKKTVEGAISKSVPVVGGVISGGITFATFRPMGKRLVDTFAKLLNGELDINMELNEDFKKNLETEKCKQDGLIIDTEFTFLPDEEPTD